eukprot:CAMPEP_0194027836 /NCGR_PEP_ID=MMETSP0009_2-20130614/1884_1 /TAXON_ID=210454 /ORGANISM="Grammatophora oceanica, Strain CCMP 410" /LENGTH=150 /DNA_ID=CAMNT_0038667011 /DNA_START=109 /DNA_END=561 /DNA_ORIENTATION=-
MSTVSTPTNESSSTAQSPQSPQPDVPRRSPNAAKVCHWLPCNIDYDGMAPVHVYFQPQEILDGEKDDDGTSLQAVQFRGRSLLSMTTPTTQHRGVVLGEKAQVVESFDTIQEWHHVDAVQQARNAHSTTQTAQEWIEIASALHGELPMEG